jgi:intein/homing endonuclease
MAISDEIELFLRNALRSKAVEDRLIRQALGELRITMAAVERIVVQSGTLAVGINRENTIRAVVNAVARSVQQTWGVPVLATLQESLAPFVEQQLTFARQMVEAAGGTLSAEGAASVQVRQVVNNAVVNGKTLADTLTATLPAQVADRVERYIRLGLSDVGGEVISTFEDAVVRRVENNVEAIIRTGVHEVGNAAQQAIYEFETDPDWLGEQGLVWTAVLDSAVCPICIGLDGKRFGTSYRKVSPHMNCVLGDTLIEPGILAAGMRSVYSGNVVTVRTHGDRLLSVTENHPVLTSNGWKPAKLLQEGDQLVCSGLKAEAVVDPNLNQSPTTAKELFALLSHQAPVAGGCVPAAPMDFHGDGAGMHGEVDIAAVNWKLLLNSQAMCAEHMRDALFVVADMQLALVDDLSTLDALLLAMHATASGFVGSSNLAASLLGSHLTPLERLRLALRARSDARFDEPLADATTSNAKMVSDLVFAHAGAVELNDQKQVGVGLGSQGDPGTPEAVTDGFDADAMSVGQFVHAHAGLVELDNVVNVQVEERHDVPVYDFSTLSGAYFASGILTHNCRCFLVPAKWRDEDMTSPSGEPVATKRPAEGDSGEQTVSFKRAAKNWVKDNPETARDIFGVRLGDQLVSGKISFDKAVKQWSAKR